MPSLSKPLLSATSAGTRKHFSNKSKMFPTWKSVAIKATPFYFRPIKRGIHVWKEDASLLWGIPFFFESFSHVLLIRNRGAMSQN